jgi:hypothetical protein
MFGWMFSLINGILVDEVFCNFSLGTIELDDLFLYSILFDAIVFNLRAVS